MCAHRDLLSTSHKSSSVFVLLSYHTQGAQSDEIIKVATLETVKTIRMKGI